MGIGLMISDLVDVYVNLCATGAHIQSLEMLFIYSESIALRFIIPKRMKLD